MMKMAQEIARKVQEEKDKADRRGDRGRPDRKSAGASASGGIWAGDEDVDAPPAYVA
jgi:distribution and morphology protein 34